MATRNFNFFINLDHFTGLLNEILNKNKVWLFSYEEDRKIKVVEIYSPDMQGSISKEKITPYFRLYITQIKPDYDEMEQTEFLPAKMNLLQFDLPEEDDNILYPAELAVKTDWYDETENAIYENKELIKFYDQLKRKLRANLKNPVTIKNIKFGDSRVYKNIYYSWTAEEWEKKGGELMQEGVENNRYFCGEK